MAPPCSFCAPTDPYCQGVFDVDFSHGLKLIEIADGVTVDEIKSKTEAPFTVADDLKPML